ncbi:CRISPR-associated protein Cas4 [Rhodobacteraceae bacterium RKSG542]|uniref:CRISPR-associated protein Cas4 n=1 Tax=Pseudovibrio flavus TaxID=2529854 RepID=UPI0012BC3E61|nr:CRISPR-associated protein Cas4 [Pseudovibrio flavus]MTI15917.1 CRISPR-associated protein Cas4 [Pseudovibrio flavus]
MASALLSLSDSVPLSALQHWLFCPRQYGLIHLDRIWEENQFTAEGRLLHEKADTKGKETRPGIKTLRAVELSCHVLGVHGVADVVELHGGVPYPVEYKRGAPKSHRADEVQLCAQALCLEEMFSCQIPEGALFYGKTRRRLLVPLGADLRELTKQALGEIRLCRSSGVVPVPHYDKARCETCSLKARCHPKALEKKRRVSNWVQAQLKRAGVPE